MREQSRLADRVGPFRARAPVTCIGAACHGGGEKPIGLVGPLGSEGIGTQRATWRFDDSTLVLRMRIGFHGGDQGSAYPYSVSARAQRGGCSGPTGYAACSQ